MSWFEDNDITTQPVKGKATTAGGYNPEALKAAWTAQPPGTNLDTFLAAHQDIAQGVTSQKHGEMMKLPGNEPAFDVVGDVGGANKPWWGSEVTWGKEHLGLSDAQAQQYAQNPQAFAQANPQYASEINPAPRGGGGGAAMPSAAPSAGGGPMPTGPMPTAPTVTNLDAPAPFSYPASSLGMFMAPSQTPTMQQQSYTPAATPTAFQGGRQAAPATLSYANLATPDGYQPERYTGLTAEQLAADPSFQFRLKTQQDAFENSAASKGVLRTGNSARGIMDLSGQLASQEYAAADARARATNAANNATSLGAFQTNAQTGLAYNQNANNNALNFGQANIANANAADATNYGRASNEAQQGYANAFQTNQANNQGQNAVTAANNASALAAQGQQFGQASTAYGLNQAAQNQGYQQALGTYGMNTGNTLAFGQANNQANLANYQAQTNAALGVGNLNLGYQNSANQYALGQGNIALGQGQLGLQASGQQFNQGLALNQNAWNQNYQLAGLGNPGAPNSQGFGQQQGNTITDNGNAQGASQIAQGNAWGGALGNIGNSAQQAAYIQWLNSQRPT